MLVFPATIFLTEEAVLFLLLPHLLILKLNSKYLNNNLADISIVCLLIYFFC